MGRARRHPGPPRRQFQPSWREAIRGAVRGERLALPFFCNCEDYQPFGTRWTYGFKLCKYCGKWISPSMTAPVTVPSPVTLVMPAAPTPVAAAPSPMPAVPAPMTAAAPMPSPVPVTAPAHFLRLELIDIGLGYDCGLRGLAL